MGIIGEYPAPGTNEERPLNAQKPSDIEPDGFDPTGGMPDLPANIVMEKHESIKLITHSKGPPTWEIKLVDKEDIQSQLSRLEEITKHLKEKYGQN